MTAGEGVAGLSAGVSARIEAAGVDPAYVLDLVRRTLAEDATPEHGGIDVTSAATVPAGQRARADFVARAPGVVAGLWLVEAVMEVVTGGTAEIEYAAAEGDRVARDDVLLGVRGTTTQLLTGERPALNLLCHVSGVATATRRWVDALAGTGAAVRDTRKTTPGLRPLEKYAVRAAGGQNHRMSLSDAALVKDNHVVAAGGVAAAYRQVTRRFPGIPVEVEVDTVEQAVEAVEAGADLVLLDNMSTEQMRAAVAAVAGRARLEASGGLALDRAAEVGGTGVDFLSVGALTHSSPILDIAMDVREVL